MSAAYYAQFSLNNGKPVGESIPATEHSVMTAWPSERAAIENMIKHHGKGLFACVMDSYDYTNCLDNILPLIKEAKEAAGGHMVIRPDSGEPVEVVLMGLKAAEKTFGTTVNEKGFKVLKGASVIQGDGIDHAVIKKILHAAMTEGYSAQCVTFGMGGGLLQKVNRDTMSFATKLSYIEPVEGKARDVMKFPKTDSEKVSLPGILKVVRDEKGIPTIYAADDPIEGQDLLKVVYDCKPVQDAFPEDFDTLKARVEEEWHNIPAFHDPISPQLRDKMDVWVKDMKERLTSS